MSEHQYYEFEAVDRRLTPAQQMELRAISSRADISATRFVNTYNYGDFRGDPDALMASFFDLHLYLANWGTRRLMLRLPRAAADEEALRAALEGCEEARMWAVEDGFVLDIQRNPEEPDDAFDRDDGEWLPALAPLREAALDGDLRLAYLAWLIEVSDGLVDEDAAEPLDGLGPLDAAVTAFAAFFSVDPDLLVAAAERGHRVAPSARNAAAEVAALSATEKDAWLIRLHGGEAGLSAALRARLRPPRGAREAASAAARRSAGDLRARAKIVAAERRDAEARAAEQARRRALEEEDRKRGLRVRALASRGEAAWREVEAEVERRASPGYDRATSLLSDLRALAERDGTLPAFGARLRAIRARHAAKRRFIERLDRTAGLDARA